MKKCRLFKWTFRRGNDNCWSICNQNIHKLVEHFHSLKFQKRSFYFLFLDRLIRLYENDFTRCNQNRIGKNLKYCYWTKNSWSASAFRKISAMFWRSSEKLNMRMFGDGGVSRPVWIRLCCACHQSAFNFRRVQYVDRRVQYVRAQCAW